MALKELPEKMRKFVMDFYYAFGDIRSTYTYQKQQENEKVLVLQDHEMFDVFGKVKDGFIFPRGFKKGWRIKHCFIKRPSNEKYYIVNPDFPITYDPSTNYFEEEIEKVRPEITTDDEGRTLTTYEPYSHVTLGARLLNETAYELFDVLIFRNLRRAGDYNILFVVLSVLAIGMCVGGALVLMALLLFGG